MKTEVKDKKLMKSIKDAHKKPKTAKKDMKKPDDSKKSSSKSSTVKKDMKKCSKCSKKHDGKCSGKMIKAHTTHHKDCGCN